MTDVEVRSRSDDAGSAFRASLLEALVESSPQGILVVSPEGRMLSFNRRFVEMWGIPDDVVESRSDDAALEAVRNRLRDPGAFLARVAYLYDHPHEESRDVIELLDGRVFERFSRPIPSGDGTQYGRVWFFRDVTLERTAEDELRRRLAQLQTISRVAATADRALLADVLAASLDELLESTTATRASVLLFDDGGVMRFRDWRGLSDDYRAAVDGHSPWTPDEPDPRPLTIADVAADESLGELRDVIAREGIGALAFVPLLHRGRLVGKFMLYHDEPHEFPAEDLTLAQTVGSHVAAAAERRRAEDALLRSRSELEAILRQVADGITVQDSTGALVYANDAAARLIGFPTAAELLSSPVADVVGRFELLDVDGNPFPLERLPGRAALRGEEAAATVRYRVRGSTAERWSVVSSTPIFDEDGEVRFAVNAFHDITPRIEAERELAFLAEAGRELNASLDYEATLRAIARLAVPRIADACSIFLVEGDELARVAHANTGDPELEGVLEAVPARYRIPADGPPIFRDVLEGAPLLASTISAELVEALDSVGLDRKTLERIGSRSMMFVPFVFGGETLGLITLGVREPGRYREADLALAVELAGRAAVAIVNARNFRQAQERGRAAQALEFVGDGVFLVDRSGEVALWNPAAEAITGLPAAAVVGRPADGAIPGWSGLAPHVPLAGRPETLPLELGDRELWVSIAGVEFDEGVVYAFRDATDEHALERMKTDFISTVSHELRTPLAAIYGAAMTIRRDHEQVRERHPELLGVIAAEAERLARTINDVLWASRIETGGLEVRIERCDPRELVDGVVAATRTHLPANLELDVGGAADLPPIAADADKVRQVLSNLLDNAVKYSPDGGTVRLSLERAGRCVRFAVVDEGLGIPAEERARIFEKFYRLDPNLTRGVGGTGLGLYICRALVEQMGGRIAVEAGPGGRGSVFTVDLPVA